MAGIDVGLFGPLEVLVDGVVVAVGGARPRALVARLALDAGRVVAADDLVDAVWGEAAPERAEHSLQQHVSAVRKRLGEAGSRLVTVAPGYRLDLDRIDRWAMEDAAAAGAEAASRGDWPAAAGSYATAVAFGRGPALADCRDTPRLAAAAVRLDQQVLEVVQSGLEARIAAGGARGAVGDLERLVGEHPLREGLWALLMLALYRAGRQADALAAYRAAREALVESLGIEPGPVLRALEHLVLDQDPALDRPSTVAALVDGSVPATGPDLFATVRPGAATRWMLELPDGQSVALPDGTSLVGRDPAALVRLVDNRVSRRHARLEASADECLLVDLGSSNGTTVNDSPVTEHRLRDGDVVAFGGVELRARQLPPTPSTR